MKSTEHSSGAMKAGNENYPQPNHSEKSSKTVQTICEKISSFSRGENSPLNQSTTETMTRISFVTPDIQNVKRKCVSNDDDIDKARHDNVGGSSNVNNNDSNRNQNEYRNENNDKCEYENICDPIDSIICTDRTSNKSGNSRRNIDENRTEVSRKENKRINKKSSLEEKRDDKDKLELQFLKITLKKMKTKSGLLSISVKKEILNNRYSSVDLEPFILEFKNLFGTYDFDECTVEKEMMCVLPDSRLLWSWTTSCKEISKKIPRGVPKYILEDIPRHLISSCTEKDKVMKIPLSLLPNLTDTEGCFLLYHSEVLLIVT